MEVQNTAIQQAAQNDPLVQKTKKHTRLYRKKGHEKSIRGYDVIPAEVDVNLEFAFGDPSIGQTVKKRDLVAERKTWLKNMSKKVAKARQVNAKNRMYNKENTREHADMALTSLVHLLKENKDGKNKLFKRPNDQDTAELLPGRGRGGRGGGPDPRGGGRGGGRGRGRGRRPRRRRGFGGW